MILSIISLTGLMMFTFLTPSSAVIIFIASTPYGTGGTGMVMCTFSAGQLLTGTSTVVLTFKEEVYDTSGMLAFVYLSHTVEFSFRNCFAILAVGALVTGVLNSLFVQSYWLADMPKYKDVAAEEYYPKISETSACLSSIFPFVLLGGIPTAFHCGAVVDKLRSVYKSHPEHLLTLPEGYERNRVVMWFN
ncbi:hypothetical protein ACTXT7_014202 [Hymenolepis weldensis]